MAARRTRKEQGVKPVTLGPITGAELASVGLATPEQVRALGWQETFERWVEAFPIRLNVNAAVGVISVVDDVSWLKLPAHRKEEARRVVKKLRSRLSRP